MSLEPSQTLTAGLQPDQQPGLWDDHVSVYEAVFERLTNDLGARALAHLKLRMAEKLIDVGAGTGGTALLAAATGAHVFAVDASAGMVKRISERAAGRNLGGKIQAEVMDGMALGFADHTFDAAVSIFGVILFPDAELGMRELYRVLKPGGRVAVVTWTEPERYELITRLINAVSQVRGPQAPPAALPAQLRFREEPAFRQILVRGGFRVDQITRVETQFRAKSARWLADNIDFAPGMARMTKSLGEDRTKVLEIFANDMRRDFGAGEVELTAVASIGLATRP
jgi:ubiquinone/menaquinone biosynthesis C-methylase UbiE